jgi:glycosyltransferase involved in cell wall biosynthesis
MFSVIVPLYNKRAYIRRAVDSVLAQAMTDFELIVVDDGSTDRSLDALADIADDRLRIIRQDNMGVGPARNAGMRAANGAWLAFLDADDAWLPQHLEELTKLAATFPEAGLLSSSWLEANGTVLPQLPSSKTAPSIRSVDYFLEASRKIGFINSTSAAVKRLVFEELGGFTTAKAGEDLEYWARVALHHPVAVSDRVTCVYFRDTGGVMQELAQKPLQRRTPMYSLREISPSVAMLCDRADENPLLWSDPSIKAYVNSRAEACIRGALFGGDPGQVRSIPELMKQPISINQRIYSIALRFPLWMLLISSAGYRFLKKIIK